jgi:hypothetical protein
MNRKKCTGIFVSDSCCGKILRLAPEYFAFISGRQVRTVYFIDPW